MIWQSGGAVAFRSTWPVVSKDSGSGMIERIAVRKFYVQPVRYLASLGAHQIVEAVFVHMREGNSLELLQSQDKKTIKVEL
jgi:hypothetical protein